MRWPLLFALAAVACSEQGALVVVSVGAQPTLSTTTLRGTATLGTRSKNFSLAVSGGAIPPQFVFGIELGSSASGTLDLTLTADGTARSAHATVAVVPHGRADLGISFTDELADLGGEPPDQTMPLLDLFDSDSLPVVTRRYVINHFTLPVQRSDFAYDLNGDGKLDNQYGNIEGAFIAQNLVGADMDMTSLDEIAINRDVQNGNYLVLIEHQSTDPAFVSDPYARVLVRRAVQHPNPSLDGTGSFTVNGSFPASRFDGVVSGSQFSSRQVSTLPQPVTLPIELAGAGAVVYPELTGAHIEYQITDSGLMVGRIQGAMPSSQVQGTFVPGIAQGLELGVATNPTSPESMQILQIFDTGDQLGVCDGVPPRDFAGLDLSSSPTCFCAVANDGHIDTCEVAQNAIIRNILNPDVDLFNDAGEWQPNSANTGKDSLSVAIGFTAVPASF